MVGSSNIVGPAAALRPKAEQPNDGHPARVKRRSGRGFDDVFEAKGLIKPNVSGDDGTPGREFKAPAALAGRRVADENISYGTGASL